MKLLALGLVSTVFVSLALKADASDVTFERSSLTGLKGIAVAAVVECDDNAFKQLVQQSTLQAHLELKLRQSGIRIYSSDEVEAVGRFPSLGLVVLALPDDPIEKG